MSIARNPEYTYHPVLTPWLYSPVFDVWEEAKRQCLSDLSAAEQQLVNTASLEEILADVQRVEEKHSQGSKARKLSRRLRPVISGIEQYGKAVDILTGAAQGILSPLWGGIRILLHVSSFLVLCCVGVYGF